MMMRDKETDMEIKGFAVLFLFLGAMLGFVTGMLFGALVIIKTELPAQEEECQPCYLFDQVRCIVDDWSNDYIAGKCKKVTP